MKNTYSTDVIFKDGFDAYIERIKPTRTDPGKPGAVELYCQKGQEYLKGELAIVKHELFARINAERNKYVHEGESAKLGMNYSKRRLLDTYIEHFSICLIKIAQWAIEQQIFNE